MIATKTNTLLKDATDVSFNLWRSGAYQECIAHVESVKPLFDETLYLRRLLNNEGLSWYGLCDYEQAVATYERALGIPLTDEDDVFEIAVIRGNLADCFVAMDRLEDAHALLDQCEPILEAQSFESWYADRLETRARCYDKQGRRDEARMTARKALGVALQGLDESTLIQCCKTFVTLLECLAGK